MAIIFGSHLRIANRRLTIRTGSVHSCPLPRALFPRSFCFQTHLVAIRTLLALLGVKVGLSKSLHQFVLADLPYLSATDATSTTWTSCDQPSHILLRVDSPVWRNDFSTKAHMHRGVQIAFGVTLRSWRPEGCPGTPFSSVSHVRGACSFILVFPIVFHVPCSFLSDVRVVPFFVERSNVR